MTLKKKSNTRLPSTGLKLKPNDQTRREKLLTVAEEVFVESGFHDATIREICGRAKMNIAMVNYHFGDKLGLYREVLNRTSSAVVKAVSDSEDDPRIVLRRFVATYLRRMHGPSDSYGMLLKHERVRPSPATQLLIETSMRPAFTAVCKLIGRILNLPPEDDSTRWATHSVIAQIRHFGEPERLLLQLDPTILSDKTTDDLAEFIVRFSLPIKPVQDVAEQAQKNSSVHKRGKKSNF